MKTVMAALALPLFGAAVAMAKKNQINCIGCGEHFEPDARNWGRQNSCAKASCRAKTKAGVV
jgi:hypothetical protein